VSRDHICYLSAVIFKIDRKLSSLCKVYIWSKGSPIWHATSVSTLKESALPPTKCRCLTASVYLVYLIYIRYTMEPLNACICSSIAGLSQFYWSHVAHVYIILYGLYTGMCYNFGRIIEAKSTLLVTSSAHTCSDYRSYANGDWNLLMPCWCLVPYDKRHSSNDTNPAARVLSDMSRSSLRLIPMKLW